MNQDIQNGSGADTAVIAGIAGVRSRIAELSASIGALRVEADRLRVSADRRLPEPEPVADPDLGRDERSGVADAEPAPDAGTAVADVAPTHAVVDPVDDAPEQGAFGLAADEDAAFDRFFSGDIEPEPAQRWLLGDIPH